MDFYTWLVEVKEIPYYNFLSDREFEDLMDEFMDSDCYHES